jgi:hypothetical protein
MLETAGKSSCGLLLEGATWVRALYSRARYVRGILDVWAAHVTAEGDFERRVTGNEGLEKSWRRIGEGAEEVEEPSRVKAERQRHAGREVLRWLYVKRLRVAGLRRADDGFASFMTALYEKHMPEYRRQCVLRGISQAV